MSVKFFEDSNALDSLRHSDFDALSAYGEVIDNSLQAGANRIAIRMECTSPRANYHQIKELLFGYDEPETLSYQIRLTGAIGADVRHSSMKKNRM